MSKEIYISSTPHETRLAIVEKDELTEIYYERENEYTLAGSIYNGRVTRVLPGMQSSFVDVGLERDAFLYITDFMEEAAEFEGADKVQAPREQRPPREPRAPREVQTSGESQPRGDGQPRDGQGRGEGRGDGRRSRGRGRRDGRNGGRTREAFPMAAPGEIVAAPVEEEIFAPVATSLSSEIEELGQGAPGADGARRWRGRRGRRRGRSGNLGLGGATVEGEPVDSVVVETGVAFEAAAPQEHKASSEVAAQEPRREGRRGGRNRRGGRDKRGGSPRERFEARAAANAEGAEPVVAPKVVEVAEVVARQEGNGRPERSDRPDRSGRGERSGRGDRGRRDRPRREERSVDVSASAAPVAAATEPTNTVEPFILPGESLSKYRRDENPAVSEPVVKTVGILVAAKPSSEAPVITGWDGGAVLPGETIRRREPATAEVRSESRGEGRGGERGRDRRRGRDSQRDSASHGDSGGRQEFKRQEFAPAAKLDPAEAVLPAVTSQHDVAEREYEPTYPTPQDLPSAPQDLPNDTVSEQDVIEVEMLDEEFDEKTVEASEPELQEETTEFEPGEKDSASYRVDPVAPQEFRQSSQGEETEEHVEEHEFTSVQPTGEMISETLEKEAAPVAHAQAVQAVHMDEVAKEAVPFQATQGFAPGAGQLEEELIEDEGGENEEEIPAVHARMVHDDSEEHETVDHAAELGRMLRDMSIDDLTHVEPVELDEEGDDFEVEEDFEEDELESTDEEPELSGSDFSEAKEDEFAETEAPAYDEHGGEIVKEKSAAQGERAPREGGRRGRRDGRRGGKNRDRNKTSERRTSEHSAIEQSTSEEATSEPSSEGGGNEGSRGEGSRGGHRDRRGMAGSRSGGRDRSRSVQATNMPSISDLLKPGQEVLVQIAKEPIAKKGARITSHIALPGRFLVFMPTVSHTGVSRKIESDTERRRLKEILLSERGDASGGFIVRTAAAGASEEDLRSDLRFLLNLWADIKARSESSKSPALIYHDLNLIERILRDQVTDNFSAIWCDTEAEYERVIRFLQRFQPELVRRVKLYEKETPLFEQFGINPQIDNALRAKVWLKSGGSIVINQTEALVAIDINTGKYVGKTTKLEDTILKTNLDAIPEIVRQMRLRDLGGIIIIDFIDMDERKNRNKVMAALEEELKKDRAPSKVLPFNDFGLIAITRKRVKQSLERTLSTTCGVCQGTGMTKSPVTVCNDLYIAMKKMHKIFEKGDIMVRVHPEVVKQLKTNGGKWLTEMEAMSGKTILLKSDPSLHPEQYDIH